jgi:hypothetical protein
MHQGALLTQVCLQPLHKLLRTGLCILESDLTESRLHQTINQAPIGGQTTQRGK